MTTEMFLLQMKRRMLAAKEAGDEKDGACRSFRTSNLELKKASL
jgi:hypothetical protein